MEERRTGKRVETVAWTRDAEDFEEEEASTRSTFWGRAAFSTVDVVDGPAVGGGGDMLQRRSTEERA